MTVAERQARRRKRLRTAEAIKRHEAGERRPFQPPYGYTKAKQALIAGGYAFKRARRDWGFEESVIVDGAYVSTHEVIALAGMATPEIEEHLEVARTR
jgi:hypothetical protein